MPRELGRTCQDRRNTLYHHRTQESMSSFVRAADVRGGLPQNGKDESVTRKVESSQQAMSRNFYSSTSLHEFGGDQVAIPILLDLRSTFGAG